MAKENTELIHVADRTIAISHPHKVLFPRAGHTKVDVALLPYGCRWSAARRGRPGAGLERWKKRHRSAAAHLEDSDVLVDAMRGRYSKWTRIRLNLEHVPKGLRPAQEALDPDDSTSLSS